jgi:hypothetical protein
VINHEAAILYHFDPSLGELLGDLVVINTHLHPD